jgi:hypothetical protein
MKPATPFIFVLPIARGWQKDYFQGRDPDSERVEYHQTKLTVRPFE